MQFFSWWNVLEEWVRHAEKLEWERDKRNVKEETNNARKIKSQTH